MAKLFDSLEDMDKFSLEMRLMKIQMNTLEEQKIILRKQTQFNKILALTTTILAFTTLLSFFTDGLTKLLFVNADFNWVGLIVAVIFSALFIWLLVEVVNEIFRVRQEERKSNHSKS